MQYRLTVVHVFDAMDDIEAREKAQRILKEKEDGTPKLQRLFTNAPPQPVRLNVKE